MSVQYPEIDLPDQAYPYTSGDFNATQKASISTAANKPQIDKLAGSETAGSFSYLDAGAEQTVFTIATSTRKKLHSIFLDLNTLTENTTILLKHKVDGSTAREFESIDWVFATDAKIVYFNKSLAINQDLLVTMEEGADEGADRAIPYYYILEDME